MSTSGMSAPFLHVRAKSFRSSIVFFLKLRRIFYGHFCGYAAVNWRLFAVNGFRLRQVGVFAVPSRGSRHQNPSVVRAPGLGVSPLGVGSDLPGTVRGSRSFRRLCDQPWFPTLLGRYCRPYVVGCKMAFQIVIGSALFGLLPLARGFPPGQSCIPLVHP